MITMQNHGETVVFLAQVRGKTMKNPRKLARARLFGLGELGLPHLLGRVDHAGRDATLVAWSSELGFEKLRGFLNILQLFGCLC